MVHDRDLLDRLSAYGPSRFDAAVFRATHLGLDPLTPSLSGGRWAPRDVTPVLYTSLEREGALAKISYHLDQLEPRPSKPVAVHEIRATAHRTLKLLRADLVGLGVEWTEYESLGYIRTQEIGAAVAFLECDGLIAPSARWPCDNMMLFTANQSPDDLLALKSSDTVDWIAWATSRQLLPQPNEESGRTA